MFHFESQIDLTRLATVRGWLDGPDSPITDVLFVRDESLLAPVAELLTDEHPTDAQRRQFARWIRDGSLQVGVQQARLSGEPDRDGRIDVDAIPDEARCRVIFLPPYYLVHLRSPLRQAASAGRSALAHG